MSLVSPDLLPLSTLVLGRFRVTGVLARGGQSMVYGVEDDEGRQLALKVNRPDTTDPHNRERLKQEGELLIRLDSPAIVSFVAAGTDPDTGLYCLVVHRVPGVPLSEVVGRGEVLAPADALSVLEQLAGALAEVHAAGQVLRDLTPAQVLCCRKPDGVCAVLVDLGFARSIGGETGLTDPACVAGTPGYLAPETLDAATLTPLADVYSLAAVAYGLLAGQAPFTGMGAEAALAAQYAGLVPPVPLHCGLGQPLRQRLDDFFKLALSPEPQLRPETPAALVAGLADCFSTGPSGWARLWNRR